MIFWASTGGSAASLDGSTAASAGASVIVAGGSGAAATGTSTGGGGGGGSGVLRIREIGGKKDRFAGVSPSARLGRGFFSSINDTVSIGGRGVAGAGGGAGFAGGGVFAGDATLCDGRVTLEGAAGLAVLTAFCLGSVAGGAGATAFAGLRVVAAGFRAAVLVVALVAIPFPVIPPRPALPAA